MDEAWLWPEDDQHGRWYWCGYFFKSWGFIKGGGLFLARFVDDGAARQLQQHGSAPMDATT
ncbi:hypothetical protein Mgra_00004904 [Meloidogyne graminicola]|uniref:Uncharacterized protein n=1 Tax=Meloidogyne graminicola TaxID=189291 RepID=A0A8S9ZR54_9BILA|nr:hypothetical protein Mgra_00004904 [Meloidogyne graminicola]